MLSAAKSLDARIVAEGGQVVMPLERQMWGDTFGMCVDKFGMPWMVNIAGAGADAPA